MVTEYLILVAAVLLFLSVLSSKASGKLGIPALLLFLVIGMLAGSEGIGKIYFDDPLLTQSLGVVALIFILFSGGLDTDEKDIRQTFVPGVLLSTVGVLGTALLVGWFATVVLKFSLLQGALLGAIVSSTDAAAIFSVLRSRKVSLRGKLRPLLEFESGSNDPMAVYLTLGIISLITGKNLSVAGLIQSFFIEFAVGAVVAYFASRLIVTVVNKINLEYEGLYQVLMIALILMTYAVSVSLKGNGFLSVYLAGVFIGNRNFIFKKALKRSFEGIAWLMQIAMFLFLGLLVFPSRMVPVAGVSLLIALFLMFVARPVCVFLCLMFTKFTVREKTMVSWVGLRGAVPIILATFPFKAGVPHADLIFNIIFFIVLASVLFQGTSVAVVSRWLKVDAPLRNKPVHPIEVEYTGELNASVTDFIVPFNSEAAGKKIFELGLPSECLVVLISRNEKYFIPNGTTVLEAGDVLLVLANGRDAGKLGGILHKPRQEKEGNGESV